MITLNTYANIKESCSHLLVRLTTYIDNVVQESNHCSLALAGGNTPKPLYKALSKQNLPWNKISITLTDERWVAADHADSNENMIKTILLNSIKQNFIFIPLRNNAPSAEEGAIITEKSLSEKIPLLDIVVLGMGDDGHFASIFPEVDNVSELLDPTSINACSSVSPPGKQDRISLTYSYLTNSKIIFLLVSGEEKKRIIDGCLARTESYRNNPVWTLLNQTKCPVQIYWNA